MLCGVPKFTFTGKTLEHDVTTPASTCTLDRIHDLLHRKEQSQTELTFDALQYLKRSCCITEKFCIFLGDGDSICQHFREPQFYFHFKIIKPPTHTKLLSTSPPPPPPPTTYSPICSNHFMSPSACLALVLSWSSACLNVLKVDVVIYHCITLKLVATPVLKNISKVIKGFHSLRSNSQLVTLIKVRTVANLLLLEY